MKKIVISTFFDTCYIGENRINMRFNFVEGVKTCTASCPEGKIYLEYDETIVTKKQLMAIVEDMDFKITKVKEL